MSVLAGQAHIAIVLFFGVAILTYSVIYLRLHPAVKASLVAFAILNGVFLYHSLSYVYGLPAALDHDLDDAWIISHLVDQGGTLAKEKSGPTKGESPEGVIYIWVKENSEKRDAALPKILSFLSSNEPVAYKIPYSEEVKKKLEKARSSGKGSPFRINLKGVKSNHVGFSSVRSDIRIEINGTMSKKPGGR